MMSLNMTVTPLLSDTDVQFVLTLTQEKRVEYERPRLKRVQSFASLLSIEKNTAIESPNLSHMRHKLGSFETLISNVNLKAPFSFLIVKGTAKDGISRSPSLSEINVNRGGEKSNITSGRHRLAPLEHNMAGEIFSMED
jgi:hypothetical protein